MEYGETSPHEYPDSNQDGQIDNQELLSYLGDFSDEQIQEFVIYIEENSSFLESCLRTLEEVLGAPSAQSEQKQKFLKTLQQQLRNLKEKQESHGNLEAELSPQIIQNLNIYVNKLIASNKLQPGSDALLFEFLGNNLQNIPEITSLFQRLGVLKNKDIYSEEKHEEVVSEISQILLPYRIYFNSDIIRTGGNIFETIEGTMTADDTLKTLLGNTAEYMDIQTHIFSNPEFTQQGYNFAGVNVLNSASVDKLLKYNQKIGKIPQEYMKNISKDEILQATVNHETLHEYLKNTIGYPANSSPFSIEEQKLYTIDSFPLFPENSVQVHEFLAHTVGQLTSKYEIYQNIGNIVTLLDPTTGTLDTSGNYGFVRGYIYHLLGDIFEQKGQNTFLSEIGEKWRNVNKPKQEVIQKMKKIQESHLSQKEKQAQEETLKVQWNSSVGKEQLDKAYGTLVQSIISQLTDKDYQYIQQSFLKISKEYLKVIK